MPGSDYVHQDGDDDRFEDPAVVGEVWRACRKCEARVDVRKGRWAATREAQVPGYHVARLNVPNTDLGTMVKASRAVLPHEIQAFRNNDLGEAWQAADAGLTVEDVLRACSYGGGVWAAQSPQVEPVVMGVDVASVRNLHAVVQTVRADGSRDAICMTECEDFRAVAELMDRYSVKLCMVDHLPETRSARALQADYPGRVLLAAYAEHPSSDPFQLDLQRAMVTANRTILLDATLDAVRRVRYRPLKRPPGKYVEHMTALHRLTEVREKDGLITNRYISVGADDWAHAEAYALLAAEALLFEGIAYEITDQEFNPASDEALGIERVRLDTERTEVYDGGMGAWERDFLE